MIKINRKAEEISAVDLLVAVEMGKIMKPGKVVLVLADTTPDARPSL
jgi:hypothetical protein